MEKSWLALLRFNAYIENLDKDKLKKNIILTLFLLLVLMNISKLKAGIMNFIIKVRTKINLDTKSPDQMRLVYRRYEDYLKNTFSEKRELSDTDSEVINRLKKHSGMPEETIAKINSFLTFYHAARFGGKRDIELESIIQSLEESQPVILPDQNMMKN